MGNENSYAVNFAINTSVNPVCTAFTKDYTVIASHAIFVFKTLKKLGLLTPGGGGGGPPASDLGRGAPTNYVIWHIHINLTMSRQIILQNFHTENNSSFHIMQICKLCRCLHF